MSKFKFNDQERAELKKEIESRIFTGPDDSQHIGTAGLFEIIDQIINDRPAPDQSGAEEVLKAAKEKCGYNWGRGYIASIDKYESELCVPNKVALKAMTTHARNEVEKAVAEKDKWIAHVEQYYNSSISVNGRLLAKNKQLLAELTEAKKRIAELESVRPELKMPSEKEMYKAADKFYEDNDDIPYGRVTAFLEGAKWMHKRLNPGVNFVEPK